MTNAYSWSNPPDGSWQDGSWQHAAPLDYAPDDGPPYCGAHPLKRGLGGLLVVFTVLLALPLLVVAGVFIGLFFAIMWCFDAGDDFAD